jgi:hypothetical protein
MHRVIALGVAVRNKVALQVYSGQCRTNYADYFASWQFDELVRS